MEQIILTAKFNVPENKKEEFKSIANQCVDLVQDNEKGKGAIQYDWFFNEDETECHVKERYTNSDAVLVHMGNVGELLGQLLQIAAFSGEMYGNISEELKGAIKGLDIKTYSFFNGI